MDIRSSVLRSSTLQNRLFIKKIWNLTPISGVLAKYVLSREQIPQLREANVTFLANASPFKQLIVSVVI